MAFYVKTNGGKMTQAQKADLMATDDDVIVSMNHCVNTNRTYVYELRNGEIVRERTIHGGA